MPATNVLPTDSSSPKPDEIARVRIAVEHAYEASVALHRGPLAMNTDAQYAERSLVVPTTEQSIGLTRAGIPATTPAFLLSAPIEAARDYLATSGPVVLVPTLAERERFALLAALLRFLRIPYRTTRP